MRYALAEMQFKTFFTNLCYLNSLFHPPYTTFSMFLSFMDDNTENEDKDFEEEEDSLNLDDV